MQENDLKVVAIQTLADSNGADSAETLRWKSDVNFFCLQHERMMAQILVGTKSDKPFCVLDSSGVAYQDFYKEILISELKDDENIRLLFFDPKFGDDLVKLINKELEELPLSQVGERETDQIRRILVIDNESYTSDLEWALIDSLTNELRASNIGVLVAAPADSVLRAELLEKAANFDVFNLRKLSGEEVENLVGQAVEAPEKAVMLAMLDQKEDDSVGSIPGVDEVPAGEKENEVEFKVKSNMWQRLRGLIKRS